MREKNIERTLRSQELNISSLFSFFNIVNSIISTVPTTQDSSDDSKKDEIFLDWIVKTNVGLNNFLADKLCCLSYSLTKSKLLDKFLDFSSF